MNRIPARLLLLLSLAFAVNLLLTLIQQRRNG